MIAQCAECKHLYKNKRSMREHQRQTGHNHNNIEANIAKLSDVAKLQAEMSKKSILIAKLEDSLKTEDVVIATLHDELDRVTKPEYQANLIRERLREYLHRMSHETYDKLGEELGFFDNVPKDNKIEGKITLNDEEEIFIGKKDEPGWTYYEAFGFSVKK